LRLDPDFDSLRSDPRFKARDTSNESGLRRAKVGSPLDARPHRQGTVSVDSGGPLAYWVAKIARLLGRKVQSVRKRGSRKKNRARA